MTNSVLDFKDYRDFLRHTLEEGIRRNAAFSLRALAKKCGVTPSYLSRVLNAQRSLSAAHAAKIASGLGLNPEETGHLLGLVAGGGTNPTAAARAQRVLATEAFHAIAEWHHFAILALAKTRGFRAEAGWIAPRLNISPTTAKLALERLQKLGFLIPEGKGWKVMDNGNFETPHDVASSAVRENHRQHLALAGMAIDQVAVDLREFANASIAMKMRDLPRAKQKLRTFLDRFIEEFEAEIGEEVIQVNLQLYPLSKIEKGRA